MHRLTASQPPDQLRTALTALHRTDGIIVGPDWIDIATAGELARQMRRQRIIALTAGVYVSARGDPAAIRRMLAALVVVDVPRFTEVLAAWDRRAMEP